LRRAAVLDAATRGRLADAAAAIAAVTAVGAGLGLLGVAWRQADELRFPGDPLTDAFSMLLGTQWAAAWWAAAGGCVVLLLGAMIARRIDTLGWALVAVGLVPLVVFPALTGHANGAEQRLIALGLDVVHVVAAGKWIGTLGVMVLIGRPWLDRLVPAFSPIAVGSVAALVVTGAAAGWREVGTLSGYWETGYGRILLLKLAIFAAVAVLGAINWRRLTPRLGSPDGDRAMGRSATFEFLLGQAVLLVTAILVRASP
jgi:putative copper export protein